VRLTFKTDFKSANIQIRRYKTRMSHVLTFTFLLKRIGSVPNTYFEVFNSSRGNNRGMTFKKGSKEVIMLGWLLSWRAKGQSGRNTQLPARRQENKKSRRHRSYRWLLILREIACVRASRYEPNQPKADLSCGPVGAAAESNGGQVSSRSLPSGIF